MKKIFTKHFLISSLSILGVMVLVLMPKFVQAQDAFDFVTGFVNKIYAIPSYAIYNGIIPVISVAVRIVGGLLDFGIQFSMNSMGILNDPSIAIGWKAVRDVCNLGFIFALIAIAISTILDTTGWFSSYDAKKKLLTVIVAATLMNFSLYATKAVIDISNVAAQWFYDATLRLVPGEDTGGVAENKSLSFTLYSTLKFAKFYQNTDLNNQGVERFAIGIALIVLNLFAIKMLWGIAFLFIGRGITFVILLITSPIYVMGFVLPQLETQQKKWIEELKTNAMLAPMFLLTLYVVLYFINSIYGPNSQLGQMANNSSGSLGTAFSYVDYIMFAIVYKLLEKCQEVAKEYSSETASQIGDTFKNGLGFVAGWAGMRTAGLVANKALKSTALADLKGSKYFGRMGQTLEEGLAGVASGDMGTSSSLKNLGLGGLTGNFGGGKGYKGLAEKEKKEADDRKAAQKAREARQGVNTARQNFETNNPVTEGALTNAQQTHRQAVANEQRAAQNATYAHNTHGPISAQYQAAQRQHQLAQAALTTATTNLNTAQRNHNDTQNNLRDSVTGLSTEQIKALGKENLEKPELLQALSSSQFLALVNEKDKPEADKKKLWGIRLSLVTNAIKKANTPPTADQQKEITSAIKRYSDKELTNLDPEILKNPNFATTESIPDYEKFKKILSSDDVAPSTKARMKDARYAKLENEISLSVGGNTNSQKITDEFKKFKDSTEIANLNHTILANETIIRDNKLLTIKVLEKMINIDGNDATRDAIKTFVTNNPGARTDIENWLTKTRGLQF